MDVLMPKKQETSMGRRLLGMAAPIAGGAFGGPAGAALGGVIGSKLTGGSTEDALMSGLKSGISEAGKGGTPQSAAPDTGIVGAGAGGAGTVGEMTGAMGRRFDAASQNPEAAVSGGLSVLANLPPDDPLRQAYAGPLIQARMKASSKLPGL